VGVAASPDDSLALAGNAAANGRGAGADGQLGDGATIDRSVPVPVSALAGQTLISAGYAHALAVAPTGQVTTTCAYDHLYRLMSGGTPGNPTAYSYDPVGNRLRLAQGAAPRPATPTTRRIGS
jgi:hypothetical protein